MYQGIGLEQTQHLQITPELQQGIEIMGMPAVELLEFIENRIQENPFIKKADELQGESPEEGFRTPQDQRQETINLDIDDQFYDGVSNEDLSYNGLSQSKEIISYDYGSSGGRSLSAKSRSDGEGFHFENIPDRSESLESCILRQLSYELRSPVDMQIATRILMDIDGSGFFRGDIEIIGNSLSVDNDLVEKILITMQTCCDPPGIGARDVAESLRSQLVFRGELDSLTENILSTHMEDLAAGYLNNIATDLQVPLQDVRESLSKIRTLDPHPTERFTDARIAILPEVSVQKDEDRWTMVIDESLFPKLVIDRSSIEPDQNGKARITAKEARNIRTIITDAERLVKAIDLRRSAIISIASAIVEHQQSFFDKGEYGLRPLTMSEIASATGVSEATVSRVANSVMMSTPQGIVSLRYFFHSGVGRTISMEGYSSLAIKQAIKELVSEEDPKNPLSDTKITELLEEKGMPISRRTVNKYRESLGILSRAKRRAV